MPNKGNTAAFCVTVILCSANAASNLGWLKSQSIFPNRSLTIFLMYICQAGENNSCITLIAIPSLSYLHTTPAWAPRVKPIPFPRSLCLFCFSIRLECCELRADHLPRPGLVFPSGRQVGDDHFDSLELYVFGRNRTHFVGHLIPLHGHIFTLNTRKKRELWYSVKAH